MQAAAIARLSANVHGRVIGRESSEYDVARKVYNGMIDRYPAAIVYCANVLDVTAAVNFARQERLALAIRSGGHNGAGFGVCDHGLVLDLSAMKGVMVDTVSRTVRAEPGCTQGEVDQATHPFGLAVPAGIVSSTGIAGLTLGGGHGYLTRKYGLTIDNLIEADVVLSDGTFVTANASRYEDLFWALRGGGGNFGVVTGFVYQAHPASTVYAGPIFWDAKDARVVMQWYREFLMRAPLELCPFLGLKTVPSTAPFPKEHWGKKVCALICCYNGLLEHAEEVVKPIRQELPPPILDWIGPMPFPAIQSLFDPLLPKGLQWYWKGDFVKELTDQAIDKHLEFAAQAPSGLSLMHLYPIDGAVHRVRPNETAWGFRDATWSMVIAGIDPDPAKAESLRTWAKRYWEAVHPYTLGGAYINFMMDEGIDRVQATYQDNYERLSEVKQKYDPSNFFRVNQNIVPTDARSG
jgi:FAD binding domain-containing protein/berberine-like enzyme